MTILDTRPCLLTFQDVSCVCPPRIVSHFLSPLIYAHWSLSIDIPMYPCFTDFRTV